MSIPKFILSAVCGLWTTSCFSQQPLPLKTFTTMRDSTTSLDIVMFEGSAGSLSVDDGNVKLFNAFFENKTASKTYQKPRGNVMWQINGREFLLGNYFLGDSTGFIVFQKDGKEYVNQINKQGNAFLKAQIK